MVCVRWSILLVAAVTCLSLPAVDSKGLPFGSGFVITHAIQAQPEFRRGTPLGEQFNVFKWLYLAYRGYMFIKNGDLEKYGFSFGG